MGNKKSDKKIKSDRINVLRKQYDFFLEEDKRRKERNEYILGQLDKMRVTTTSSELVLRHRVPTRLPEFAVDPPPVFYDHENPINTKQSVHEPRLTQTPQTQPLRPFMRSGEELLREIGKKFILIPKLDRRHTLEVPEENKSFVNENDWKSKYDILDQLKKNVKESVEPVSKRSLKITDHVQKANNDNNFTSNAELDSVKPSHGLNINMIYNEVPERDVALNKNRDDTANREKKEKYEENYVDFNQSPDENHKVVGAVKTSNNTVNVEDAALYDYTPNHSLGYGIDPVDTNAPKYQEIQFQTSNQDSHPNITEKCYNPDKSNLENTYQQNEFEDKGQTEIPEKDYYKEENNVMNLDNINEEIRVNNEVAAVVHQDNTNIEATEYTTEINKCEDVTTAGNIIVKHGVSVNSPEYEEGNVAVEETQYRVASNEVNTSVYQPGQDYVNNTQNAPGSEQVPYEEQYPQNTELTGETENDNYANDAAAIQEFEQENTQMFYTEPTNATEDANAYNTEYTGEQPNYDTNAEYQYYEGQQQIEYAENAADQQPYDQNYRQQYGQQPYEDQQQLYEQQQQGYEQQQQEHQQQEQAYDPQQQENDEQDYQTQVVDQQNQPEEYDQKLYYEKNTPKMPEIEQQLDQEQSFADPTPPVAEVKADPKLTIIAD